MRIAVVAFVLFFSRSALADNWNTTDYVMLGASSTLLVLDWAQTRDLVRSENYRERNPILGEHPNVGDVDKYFATALLLNAGIAYLLPQTPRRLFLGAVILVETGTVIQNYRIGLRFAI